MLDFRPTEKNDFNDLYVKNILESQTFKFAKTMASHNPHSYTLKKTWENQKLFEQIVFYIQQYGNKERCKHKYYTQLYLGEYKYWTMGYPINQTILINRKPKNIL